MKLYTGSFKWGSEFFFILGDKKKVYGYNLFVLYVVHFGDQIQLIFYAWDKLLILLGSLWYCQ